MHFPLTSEKHSHPRSPLQLPDIKLLEILSRFGSLPQILQQTSHHSSEMSSLQYHNDEGYGETCGPLFHYSQSVTVGNIVKVSGQGGWTFDGSLNLDGDD